MTRRTASTSPARFSNHFEPNPDALPVDALLSTAEVAQLLSLAPAGVLARAQRLHLTGHRSRKCRHYWTPEQVERLRAAS